MRALLVPKGRNDVAMGASPHLLILLPSPWSRGEGLGVRDFALFFDREFNALLRFRIVNK